MILLLLVFMFKISVSGAPLKTCVSAHHRCVCIIDCFEMFTERTWKQEHKHTRNTNIAIQWNTKLARRSDKHVTEQSGFLDSLSTGGVTLTESFRLHNPELKIPASSKEKTTVQLRPTEGHVSLRVHVGSYWRRNEWIYKWRCVKQSTLKVLHLLIN